MLPSALAAGQLHAGAGPRAGTVSVSG